MRIFILEDDLSLQKGIALKLMKEGHELECAADMATALYCIRKPWDMAVIDVNLPDGSGLDICRRLRESSRETHILILTANDQETDIVMGYELGADDYMTKPFSLSVLLSKINAVKRRIGDTEGTRTDSVLDPVKQTAAIRGRTVNLTGNELRLLKALLQNSGQVLTKGQLLQILWDTDGEFVDENTLAVNIRRLREKIEEDPGNPVIVENIRGVGYRLNKDML